MGLRLAHILACSLLGALALAPHAQSQDKGAEAVRGPLTLHWVRLPGSEACIAGDALARNVESKLRRSVFPAPRDASVLIEGHVERSGDGYRADLRMTDASGKELGSRSLSSADASCRELSETLGVVLAVMIDPDAARRAASATPAAEDTKAAPAPAERGDNRTLAFTRVMVGITRKPWLGFGAAYERALGVAGGVRVEAAVFLENAENELPERLPDNARTLTRLAYAGLGYCPLWLAFSLVRLSGCAGIELGRYNVHNDRFPIYEEDKVGWWWSASASARLSIRLVGKLEAHLGASLLGFLGEELRAARGASGGWFYIVPKNKQLPLGGAFDLGLGARF